MPNSLTLWLAALYAALACIAASASGTLIIEDVTVIPVTREGGTLTHMTVTIEDGRIVSI